MFSVITYLYFSDAGPPGKRGNFDIFLDSIIAHARGTDAAVVSPDANSAKEDARLVGRESVSQSRKPSKWSQSLRSEKVPTPLDVAHNLALKRINNAKKLSFKREANLTHFHL
jgi:hypothetical protein